jgi:cytochrome c nitrite reductase small subunit
MKTSFSRRDGSVPLVSVILILGSVLMGLAAGVGGFTFVYAKGISYMSDDPAVCMNCHVMNEEFHGWSRGSHHDVATCNDCHTPKNFFGKYFTKALNGYHHSRAFTEGGFHEPIQIKARNRAITQARCRSCHDKIVDDIDTVHQSSGELDCIRCHRSVGHL